MLFILKIKGVIYHLIRNLKLLTDSLMDTILKRNPDDCLGFINFNSYDHPLHYDPLQLHHLDIYSRRV